MLCLKQLSLLVFATLIGVHVVLSAAVGGDLTAIENSLSERPGTLGPVKIAVVTNWDTTADPFHSSGSRPLASLSSNSKTTDVARRAARGVVDPSSLKCRDWTWVAPDVLCRAFGARGTIDTIKKLEHSKPPSFVGLCVDVCCGSTVDHPVVGSMKVSRFAKALEYIAVECQKRWRDGLVGGSVLADINGDGKYLPVCLDSKKLGVC